MRNTTSDISPTHWVKVSSRVYCSTALFAKTRSNFSGLKTRSSVPRTMTLTGLRSRNFSKHLPKTILLAPVSHDLLSHLTPQKRMEYQKPRNYNTLRPLQGRVGIAYHDGTVGATETVGGAHPALSGWSKLRFVEERASFAGNCIRKVTVSFLFAHRRISLNAPF